MVNTAKDFHKQKMMNLKDSELWNVIHESPSGLMSTPSSKDKMFAAIEILDERQEVYRDKVDALESRMNRLEGKKSTVSETNVKPPARRGRPKKVAAQ